MIVLKILALLWILNEIYIFIVAVILPRTGVFHVQVSPSNFSIKFYDYVKNRLWLRWLFKIISPIGMWMMSEWDKVRGEDT